MSSATHLHLIAEALRIPRETGCQCRVCGASPYPPHTLFDRVSDTFTDFDLCADPAAPMICAACVRLLGGRPGDDPKPLRMTSLCVSGGELHQLRTAEIWPVMAMPPDGNFVLSWATGGKKHHILRAGVSRAERMLIGADGGAVEYIPPRDLALIDAVLGLLANVGTEEKPKPAFSRDEIRQGTYRTERMHKFGAQRWSACEAVVSRSRGTLLLDLLCAVLPCTTQEQETEASVIDQADETAGRLLGLIAQASDLRANDGIMFWGGLFKHRVTRFSRLPLPGLVSRLITELCCGESHNAIHQITTLLAKMPAEEQAEVEASIRLRTGLVLALAYDHRK